MSKIEEVKKELEHMHGEAVNYYSEIQWLIQAVERYEKALKAYGDEEGKNILQTLEESERTK